MKLSRRNFLAWAGLSSVGAVACEGFGIREGEFSLQSPAALPEDLVRGKDNWYATLCRTCPSCEGIVVRVMEGRAKKIHGNPSYPTNMGTHSARCEAGLQALYHPDRISGPMRRSSFRGSGQFEPVDWATGLNEFRAQLQGRSENMLAVTEPLRGHLGMVVEKFARAMGGRHLAFEPLDTVTLRMALKNVFGREGLPDFDIGNANFLVSFGSDILSTWIAPNQWNLAYGEFRQGEGRTKRGTLFHVDPRFSMTAANADQWVPISPGREGYLALSMAYVIISEGLQAPGVDVGRLTGGRGAEALETFRPDEVAGLIGLPDHLNNHTPVEVIQDLARRFAAPENRPSLAIGGGSAGAHSNGLFNLEAIYALNYLVGSVGVAGGIRFNPESPLPDVPASAGGGSLADWATVASELRSGKTRMVLLHNADPVHGLPGAMDFRDALDQDDLFIVSFSPFLDDTSVMADLILPDRLYLEDWGSDLPEPGPGFQTIGIQQPVVNPLSDLDPRSFADVLLTIASEMGRGDVLPWDRFDALLKDSSRQLFEMNRGSIQAETANEFWNKMLAQGGWWDETATGPGPVDPPDGLLSDIVAKASQPRFPGLGTSGNVFHLVPFSHHTLMEGQNAHLPWLQATPDPVTTMTWQTWVEMSDYDGARLGVREGDIVRINSAVRGSIEAPVFLTPANPPGLISVPFGQGREFGSDTATGRQDYESSNLMAIVEPSQVDDTGALAWASTTVTVAPTGRSINVSKFEGAYRAVEIGTTPAEQIIHTIIPEEG